jgi:gamma-glutamylcyclotransferase (GGCT)/AIG2-like uncharacterized protein YtfP
VYGTLRDPRARSLRDQLVRESDFIGRAVFQGLLYDLGAYPGVVPSHHPEDLVSGEVFALRNPELLFEVLDRYEAYNPKDISSSLYIRVKADVVLEEGRKIQSWLYLYNRSVKGVKRIDSGDYLDAQARTI